MAVGNVNSGMVSTTLAHANGKKGDGETDKEGKRKIVNVGIEPGTKCRSSL